MICHLLYEWTEFFHIFHDITGSNIVSLDGMIEKALEFVVPGLWRWYTCPPHVVYRERHPGLFCHLFHLLTRFNQVVALSPSREHKLIFPQGLAIQKEPVNVLAHR